tara:strand:- start:661 stop:960 length:300 start_codon:yes stop_codon:yes gene_type:complete
MIIYLDAAIEYWADIFQALDLKADGLRFETFIEDPWSHLFNIGQETAPEAINAGYKPLTRKQAVVARNIQRQWDAQDQRDHITERRAKPKLRLVTRAAN